MKLLLAEDNPADARLVRELLAGPAPDAQGMQTLERALEVNRSLPIVVLTGLDDERFAGEVVRAGAQDYLVKGKFDRELLIRTVRYAAERKRAEEKIRHLAAIVSSSREGIISETLEGKIVSWNAGAERIYGYAAEEMLGQSVSRLCVPTADEDLSLVFDRLRRGESIDQCEVVRRRKDGQEINVALSFSPICDGRGHVMAASVVATDITARKRAEEALVRSHAELRRFSQMAVGRELKIIELKRQVNALMEELGRPPPYRLDFAAGADHLETTAGTVGGGGSELSADNTPLP